MSFKSIRLIRSANLRRMAIYLLALWKLFRHPQASGSARMVSLLVMAYVISPVDLVPDVMPLLGQLDDLVLIPLGVTLASHLTPPTVWQACLQDAERHQARWPRWWMVLLGVALLWMAVLVALVVWLLR
jgi:uncharacterized membrane protein YkvA (DUF1232 family)